MTADLVEQICRLLMMRMTEADIGRMLCPDTVVVRNLGVEIWLILGGHFNNNNNNFFAFLATYLASSEETT